MKKLKIAIDGPSASGKSTIAKLLAKKLHYIYIDTGAMYRCVGYYALLHHIDLEDEKKVTDSLKEIHISMDQKGHVFLNDQDVSLEIRKNEVSMAASKVSTYQAVREFLVAQQRALALSGGVILDGRDIGTVVLPDAQLKIYQVASVETRAKRRYLENKERGINGDLRSIEKEIEQRDYQDMHRTISPLKKAKDAIEIDTSDMSLDEVLEEILQYFNKIKEE